MKQFISKPQIVGYRKNFKDYLYQPPLVGKETKTQLSDLFKVTHLNDRLRANTWDTLFLVFGHLKKNLQCILCSKNIY